MTKLALCVVIAAVVLFRGLEAFEFDHQPEDDILDQWLKEEMANTQAAAAMEAADLGFATPGHVEEQEFMTAFFENQDHGAFADVAKSDNHVDDYLAEFFSYGETEDNVGEENKGIDSSYLDVFGQDATPDYGQGGEEQNAVSENAALPAADEDESYLADYYKNYEQKNKEQKSYAVFAKIEGGEEEEEEVNADREFAGTQEAERVVEDQPEEASESDNDKVFGDAVQEHYEDVFGTDQGEAPSDDLDLWLQAMVEPEEEEAEDEEDEGTLMDPAFDAEFPDDDLFPEVMVQAATKFNLLCLAWKNKMTVAQATVNAQGKVLQAKIAVLNAVIKAFRTKLKVLCQKKCGTICVPVDDGEECLDSVNGTCVLTAPKTKDCGERIRDPECDIQAADCETDRKEIADKVKKLRDEQNDLKDKLDGLTKKLMDLMESVPQKCLQGMEPHLQETDEE